MLHRPVETAPFIGEFDYDLGEQGWALIQTCWGSNRGGSRIAAIRKWHSAEMFGWISSRS